MTRAGVRVPATSANLGPGYDAFGVALSTYLVAEAVERRAERVTTSGEGAGEVATDDTNLVWRSVLAFCERFGLDVPDVTVAVDNAIPLERGMGSSSAAIVAGLSLARALLDHEVADLEVAALATEIEGHPDNVVPALLGGITVTATADDGTLVVRRAQPHARLRPVVLVPTVRQNTNEARGVVPAQLSSGAAAAQAARAGHVLGALTGVWPADARLVGDHLHEPPRLQVMGASGAVIGVLRTQGHHAWLSGAGPSVAVAVPDAAALADLQSVADEHGFAMRELRWDLGGATATV